VSSHDTDTNMGAAEDFGPVTISGWLGTASLTVLVVRVGSRMKIRLGCLGTKKD